MECAVKASVCGWVECAVKASACVECGWVECAVKASACGVWVGGMVQ